MSTSRGGVAAKSTAAFGSAAVAVGVVFSQSAQAATVIDLPQPGGNTIQVGAGGDAFAPQFNIWPFPSLGSGTVITTGNTAENRGVNTEGKAFLLGFGAGNVLQFATGGNIIAPQFGIGKDNNLTTTANGNTAIGNGVGSASASDGAGAGTGNGILFDGNGNVFQVAFLQGNIFAPQFNVGADNNGSHSAYGNYAEGNGTGANSDSQNGWSFVTGNGNIIQIEILSHNVIAPQFVVIGDNNLDVYTDGNLAYGNGSGAVANVNGSNPLAGIFSVTGNGNVTHISILSNNIWAPQIALFGHNGSELTTDANDSQGGGNEAEFTGDNAIAPSHPIIDGIANALNAIGITEHPVLDAIVAALPGSQVGNGNTQQQAHNSGWIFNPQIGGPTIVVPVKVTPDPEPEPEPEPQAITMALSGGVSPSGVDPFGPDDVALPGGGAEGLGGKGTTGVLGDAPTKHKRPQFGLPGHSIKKALKKIHDPVHTKRNPPTGGGTGSSRGTDGPAASR